MKNRFRGKGFTLLELLIAVTILAIMLVIAAPSFQTFMANREVRNVAEAIHNGMLEARANAIKTNSLTVLVMNLTGKKYEIQQLTPSVAAGSGTTTYTNTLISSYSWDGSSGVDLTLDAKGGNAVTFDSLGRVRPTNIDGAAGVTNTAPISYVAIAHTPALEAVYPLRVEAYMTGGRGVRLCAPNITDANDPKACTN